jgi:hypothetical protein
MPATTIDAYIAALAPDRRVAIEKLREVIRANMDPALEEGMQYGMIGYYVPHSVFPAGYHCDPKQPLPFAALASPKSHLALHLMCAYVDGGLHAWFEKAWKNAGKRLDMGKACVRFKSLEDVPLEVVGEFFRRAKVRPFIDYYVAALPADKKAKVISAKGAESKKATPARAARAGTAAQASRGKGGVNTVAKSAKSAKTIKRVKSETTKAATKITTPITTPVTTKVTKRAAKKPAK